MDNWERERGKEESEGSEKGKKGGQGSFSESLMRLGADLQTVPGELR